MCPAAWFLLQPDLLIFLLSRNHRRMCTIGILLSRNLYETCMVGLMSRAAHRVVADDMAGGTTIEANAIVTSMLPLDIG